MKPLEILRKDMDEDYFAFTEKLIENGATWQFSAMFDEVSLHTAEGKLLVAIDFSDLEWTQFECTNLFENLFIESLKK